MPTRPAGFAPRPDEPDRAPRVPLGPHPTPPVTSFLDTTPGFGLDNLPYGVFSRGAEAPRCATRVGDTAVDLAAIEALLPVPEGTFAQPALNAFMAAGKGTWDAVRERLQSLLAADGAAGGAPDLRGDADLRARALVPLGEAAMHLPARIGDYTDFYSSRQHATNVGTMFRGAENALMPNWLHLPVGYHGRASSVVVSGTPVVRPRGQTTPGEDGRPGFGPSRQLDIELELGVFVGPGNALGEPVAIDDARDHVFGYVLVNDWSARDIQRWEYVPLGPFLAKSFCTTVSPWVVPAAALDPFRIPGEAQSGANPEPLPYLRQTEPRALDVALRVSVETEQMRASGAEPETIARSNAKYLYWSPEQQLAHHTVAGCNLRPGDLFASGTISGETEDSYGSLLELTWRGERPLDLPGGETRTFLEDGDRVVLSGTAERGETRVSFGTVEATIAPAPGT